MLQQQKAQMAQFEPFLGVVPKTRDAIKELMDSFKYTADGPALVGTGQVSRATFNAVVQELQGLGGQLQGAFGGGAPGGGLPGGGLPGGGIGGGKGGGQPGGGMPGGGKKGGGGAPPRGRKGGM